MRHAFHGPKRHALRRHTFKRHSAAFIVLALAFSTLAFTGAFTGEARAAGDGRKGPGLVVVELYTSQSCSSCPPADKFLGELAKRKDILALSMHVDYWNVLGWRDPWSSADVTARQRRYMRSLGARYVSTPQAIIGGESYAVGSNRPAVFRLIEKARRAQRARVQPIVTMPVPGRLTVTLPDVKLAAPATVWFVAFDDRHTARITAGENTGATITYTNVVRALRPIGTWTGKARSFEIDISKEREAGFGNCAILVQAGGSGPILGAVSLPLLPAVH
ncbi:MAG: DUF1223 domain-containing protein [Proteobacteria bacterium]|nr:DUF1223 domain-containing protein [Pseudomonadota bacterium]